MVTFHHIVFQCYSVISSEHSLPNPGIELGAALVALQTSLKLLEQPNEK